MTPDVDAPRVFRIRGVDCAEEVAVLEAWSVARARRAVEGLLGVGSHVVVFEVVRT